MPLTMNLRPTGDIASWQEPGFGCSDCACASHLFGMADDPLKNAAFIDMLLGLRMGALAPLLA